MGACKLQAFSDDCEWKQARATISRCRSSHQLQKLFAAWADQQVLQLRASSSGGLHRFLAAVMFMRCTFINKGEKTVRKQAIEQSVVSQNMHSRLVAVFF
jgi:hypothetical protein